MKKIVFAFIAALSVGGVAVAQDRNLQSSIEARLERLEQAIARLEKQLSARAGGGMMESCQDMMSGGMMGGGMGGMMGGGQPNNQWRAPERMR